MPVFRLFFDLAVELEGVSRAWKRDFIWLRGQVLRASESVCANMTEGFYSQYSTEYLQALFRCRREGNETVTHLRYAYKVGLLPATTAEPLLKRYDTGLRQLTHLIGSIERKISRRGKAKPPVS